MFRKPETNCLLHRDGQSWLRKHKVLPRLQAILTFRSDFLSHHSKPSSPQHVNSRVTSASCPDTSAPRGRKETNIFPKSHLTRELCTSLPASTAREHHGESHSNRLIYHILRNDLSLSNWCLKCPPGFGEPHAIIAGNKHTSSAAQAPPGWEKQSARQVTGHTNTGTGCLCLPAFPAWDIWGGQGSNVWETALDWTTELAAVSPSKATHRRIWSII